MSQSSVANSQIGSSVTNTAQTAAQTAAQSEMKSQLAQLKSLNKYLGGEKDRLKGEVESRESLIFLKKIDVVFGNV